MAFMLWQSCFPLWFCKNLFVKNLVLYFSIFVMQSMIQISEESIPRSAENIGLAVGALCAVKFLCNNIVDSII